MRKSVAKSGRIRETEKGKHGEGKGATMLEIGEGKNHPEEAR